MSGMEVAMLGMCLGPPLADIIMLACAICAAKIKKEWKEKRRHMKYGCEGIEICSKCVRKGIKEALQKAALEME